MRPTALGTEDECGLRIISRQLFTIHQVKINSDTFNKDYTVITLLNTYLIFLVVFTLRKYV